MRLSRTRWTLYHHRLVNLKWQTSDLTALERTKVFIGQAIMARANVILLSSPSSSLEWEEKRQLWSLISSLKRNRAIFVATNSLQEAEVSLRLISPRLLLAANTLLNSVPSRQPVCLHKWTDQASSLYRSKD